MTAADWELLSRESVDYANLVFDRVREKRAAAEQSAREDRERYQEGVPRYEGWDCAARHSAIRDALLNELRRVDPANPLLDAALREKVGARGREEFIRHGRRDIGDANIISNGVARI